MLNENAAKWQREIAEFLGVKSTFILEGNTKDLYPTNRGFQKVDRAIEDIFAEKYNLLFCDPLFGFYSPTGETAKAESLNPDGNGGKQEEDPVLAYYKGVAAEQRCNRTRKMAEEDAALTRERLTVYSEIIRAALTVAPKDRSNGRERSVACIVNFASRSVVNPAQLNPNENIQYMNLLYASINAIRCDGRNINTLILIVEKQNDLPAWFYLNNPNVRTITLPAPDRKMRHAYVEERIGSGVSDGEQKQKFVDMTERMRLTEIDEVIRMNRNSGAAFDKIGDNLSVFKYGVKENKWETELKDKFAANKDIAAIISGSVKGQDKAVNKISQIIKRAITGLSGLQHSSGSSKPRGIAFLAGPTGTGKTETVKAVTRLLFDDEKAMVRFDMSEFSESNSSQRLFGAPPGYVGYDNGGQLTNAIKANPFSVILFDEIEKAHFSIMDKFLQVLEDGRMTDGQGNTVYFSETVIFFTSNIGIVKKNATTGEYEPNDKAKPGTAYEELEAEVNDQIRLNFKPELLNRIGRNIVVFDYIQDNVAEKILAKQIKTAVESLDKRNHIILNGLDIHGEAFNFLLKECVSADTKSKGGRGIGNVVEDMLLNLLSDYIFNNNISNAAIEVYVSDGKLAFRKG